MLKSISIENIAIIERADLDLTEKLNILTGETGAGKSIIIDSINAVLGERTSKELIRRGSSSGSVSALFCDIGGYAAKCIEDLGFSLPDGQIMLQRILKADGKSVSRINGTAVTAGVMKQVGACLVDIHGQHDNQLLLNPATHINFIDAFAENGEILAVYEESYKKLRDVKRRLIAAEKSADEKHRLKELYSFEIAEIEAANITVGERDALNERKNVLLNSQKIAVALSEIIGILNGGDDNGGAVHLTQNAGASAAAAGGALKELKALAERLVDCSAELSDISNEARRLLDGINFSAAELEEIEQRLDEIYKLSQKYGGSEQEIISYLNKIKTELKTIENDDKIIAELEDLNDIYEQEVYENGQKLTSARKTAAEDFSHRVCEVLKYLEMPNIKLAVDITECIYTKMGCDNVEILISTNPGEPPKPLSKVASGGELSRVMLAIKSVMAEKDNTLTLIFDEIDTGISGRAAGKVGRQLKDLSQSHQVICVTHLAQIAAAADNHLFIEKAVRDGRTYTSVKALTLDERVAEVARIISGGEMSENLLQTAKELIENHGIISYNKL